MASQSMVPSRFKQRSTIACKKPRRSKIDDTTLEKFQQVSLIPHSKRRTQRQLAVNLKISRSTTKRRLKAAKVNRRVIGTRPVLTEKHIDKRLKHFLAYSSFKEGNAVYDSLYDHVFVDEKWFTVVDIKGKVYLAPWEDPLHLQVKNKRFVPKVMFLVAVARPRLVDGVFFDGKIGAWPFLETVEAKKTTRNRPAGTLMTVGVAANIKSYKKLFIIMSKVQIIVAEVYGRLMSYPQNPHAL
ncbi:hypothetical protein H310_00237 [Aphanomyces invadans]|uniref:Transposase Tc1-like domain-containing protein n=1 Tax=Aphanomyces invadans TaxID=157072 RepID=A0A024UUZ3_9STRA|nr:hypothetical protein H310_00237 [Aphanomyces invadans]ETW09752.1 hypothetical protein H310_00237 [Aphanomyces invadans]|eukprot:XP_008861163.1 hypothetical protein H310_00237 [Aphanomyces invadans]